MNKTIVVLFALLAIGVIVLAVTKLFLSLGMTVTTSLMLVMGAMIVILVCEFVRTEFWGNKG